MSHMTDSWDLGFQDESILSSGRKMQGGKQPRVWRGARVVSPSSRKERKENTTALKFCSARRLQRATNFTLCGVHLPGDTESQRRVQRENGAFAKRKREKIFHGGSEFFVRISRVYIC